MKNEAAAETVLTKDFRSIAAQGPARLVSSIRHPLAIVRLMVHRQRLRQSGLWPLSSLPKPVRMAYSRFQEAAGLAVQDARRRKPAGLGKAKCETIARGRGKFVWPMSSFSKPTD